METGSVLTVKNISKNYKSIRAVTDVSFGISQGEVVGLLGPNGAGKTTIINIILGVLEASIGEVEILGKNLRTDRSVMSQINFAAVYAQLPGNLTVWQNLYIFGLLYGVVNLAGRIKELLSDLELENFAQTKVGLLSSGEQTRVSLAKALLNQPKLLLLDEPTASLDPSSAQVIRAKIKDYVQQTNSAVLWTSHNMHEVAAVCDRVMFISRGQICLAGNPRELPVAYGKRDLEDLFIAVARENLKVKI